MFGTATICDGKVLVDLDRSNSKARELFQQGKRPSFSHDITGELSVGYGFLDDLGFWQFPLHVDRLK